MSLSEPPTELEDLPPGAKFVYKVLEYEEPLTQAELIEETHLGQRTVYNALRKLEDRNLIESKPRTDDLRQCLYWINRK